MSKKQIKKDTPNQVEEKAKAKKPQSFSTYIADVTPSNGITYFTGKDKKMKKIVSLAYVEVPRFDKEKKKEECFSYECGEYLRKKLITGKLVKLEIIHKNQDEEIKAVVPMVGKENIVVTLLEKGFVVLRQSANAPEIYKAAEQKAKENKCGIHHEDPVSVAQKRPEAPLLNEKESQKLIGTTIKGFIRKIEAPGIYLIEMENRKQVYIRLYAIDQYLSRGAENRWVFDEDGKAAMEHCRQYYFKRDVTVEVKEAGNGNLYGVIRQDKKDIGEDLIRNGFVIFKSKKGDVAESIKQVYVEAEKEAKKEKRARWTEFDQAEEDRIIREREEREKKLEERKKNCKVIVSPEIKKIGRTLVVVKDGKTFTINFASIRFHSKKGNEDYNDLVDFRIKECIRKQIVGKRFECKETHIEKVKGKSNEEVEKVFYDVYAGGKNIMLNLFKEGLVYIEKQNDAFKRSFDYERYQELAKSPVAYVEKKVQVIGKEERGRVKDLYKSTEQTCIIEKIISPTKYVIYNPEKDHRMRIALNKCYVPRDDDNKELQEFLNEGKKFIRQNVGLNEVTVKFEEIVKEEFLCDVKCKKFEFIEELIDNGYVMTYNKELVGEKVEAMKEAGEKIYKFLGVKKPREDKPKPVVREKKEVAKELKFGEGRKVYITGYDGKDVYYYENAEDLKPIEELSNKMKAIKRAKVEEKAGTQCVVDVKGKFYRATIVDPVPAAFVVKCNDTGAIVVCGKNKLKPITEEIAKEVIAKEVQHVALIGLKTPVRGKHEEYEKSIQKVAEYYTKEAMLYEVTLGETQYGKVIVGDVCINTQLVAEGLAVLSRNFRDASEWGNAMRIAEASARETHSNMWKYGEVFDDEERDQK